MDRERSPKVVGKQCVVWGCGATAKSGHGMFLWPKDEHRAAAWTKQVQQTWADFDGPGKPGSAPGHFVTSLTRFREGIFTKISRADDLVMYETSIF